MIYLAREAQMASLLAEEVTIPAEYADFVDVFLKKLAEVLLEQTNINEHAIELEEGKQPPMGLSIAWARWNLRSSRLTSRPTWPIASFGHQNHLLVLPSYLSVSPIIASNCALITEV